jgi:hypothetical protein
MKTIIGTSVVFAGLILGVSNAIAHPAISCSCAIVLRNGSVATFDPTNVQHVEITRTESGNVNANCKVDLGSGPQMTFCSTGCANTIPGFVCLIDGQETNDWQEVISANGQTTLTCKIP